MNTSDEVAPLVIAETVGAPAVLGALYLLVKVIVMVFCGSAANPLPCQVTEAVIGVCANLIYLEIQTTVL